jgi:hypothetical protein
MNLFFIQTHSSIQFFLFVNVLQDKRADQRKAIIVLDNEDETNDAPTDPTDRTPFDEVPESDSD